MINNKLYDFRKKKGLSQEQLAEAVGVSRQTINAIERGRYLPSIHLALTLAKLFSEPVETIFFLEENS